MLDKGKPAIYWGIFTEEGYGIMPARGRWENGVWEGHDESCPYKC